VYTAQCSTKQYRAKICNSHDLCQTKTDEKIKK